MGVITREKVPFSRVDKRTCEEIMGGKYNPDGSCDVEVELDDDYPNIAFIKRIKKEKQGD